MPYASSPIPLPAADGKTEYICISDLYAPGDLMEAHDEWGASCGPCALAALCAVPLAFIRPRLGDYGHHKTWMNKRDMLNACASLKLKADRIIHVQNPSPSKLCLIQFGGPWTRPGANLKWALKYTHWVSVIESACFDCNVGFWTTKDEWKAKCLPQLLSDTPRADGSWFVRETIVVDLTTIPGAHPAFS